MTTRQKIGEVADASGFTAATLRCHGTIGLLREVSRTPANDWTYDRRTLQLGRTLDELALLTTAWSGSRRGPIQGHFPVPQTVEVGAPGGATSIAESMFGVPS